MSAELDAKWLELVAAGKAKWMSGMLASCEGFAPLRLAREVMPFVWWGSDGTPQDGGHCLQGDALPDWSDPATLGALLGQVRARYMDPTIYARPQHVEDGHGWTLYDALGVLDLRGCPRSGPDEVSALLRGLELAP